MSCHIVIGNYYLTHCNSFVVNSSWKNLTQTATLKLHNISGLLDKIAVGDAVKISAGYDDELQTEFEGYISEINPNTPVEIKCEDEMWKLKQQTVSNSWRNVTLSQLLKYLVPDSIIECPEVDLSPFRIDNVTKAKVLQTLKDEFLLTVYFRNKKLYVGLPYQEKGLGEVIHHFQRNAIADNLIFKRKDDLKIKVKAISVLPDNKRIVKEFGDSDGDSTTLHFYNKKESELKSLAEEAINRMKYSGYRGSFMGFGVPYVTHGMIDSLYDDKYPERQYAVFVDAVTTEYGPNGFRRKIEPGRKVLNG